MAFFVQNSLRSARLISKIMNGPDGCSIPSQVSEYLVLKYPYINPVRDEYSFFNLNGVSTRRNEIFAITRSENYKLKIQWGLFSIFQRRTRDKKDYVSAEILRSSFYHFKNTPTIIRAAKVDIR